MLPYLFLYRFTILFYPGNICLSVSFRWRSVCFQPGRSPLNRRGWCPSGCRGMIDSIKHSAVLSPCHSHCLLIHGERNCLMKVVRIVPPWPLVYEPLCVCQLSPRPLDHILKRSLDLTNSLYVKKHVSIPSCQYIWSADIEKVTNWHNISIDPFSCTG